MTDPEGFYDDLVEDYHLVYADWDKTVREYSESLDRLIREEVSDRPLRVLDCTCGIGTQAIGLALHGHTVHGSDLSGRSIDRARREAAAYGVEIDFHVADVRRVADIVRGTFNVVLSTGNSLPHLLTDADQLAALGQMRRKLAPGGLLVIGTRDYDAYVAERPRFMPPMLTGEPGDRAIVFQLWDWDEDGSALTPTLFVLRQEGARWEMTARTTRYRALRRDDLGRLLAEAGFANIRWEPEERTWPHYPTVTARAGGATNPSS